MDKEEDLFSFYRTEFDLKQYGNYSIDEQNELFPYEKQIHLFFLIEKLKKENEAIKASRTK